ncbi:MAG: O-acetylhomoserine aminocarboxypropyltransferase/cysteine synthase [Peptococcaceae bacterium]|nr:O-acetylhomoserine aminocarboxypropyltransferase/cysteine synthase [Peptococcaceae bacterium]
MKNHHIDTLCVQAGHTPQGGDPRVLPIVQSTTFKYDTCDAMGQLFDLEAAGYFYSRLANPTCDTVAQKIAALEGGVAAMLTASGQAASFFSLFNICGAGDHIVSTGPLYGGTFNLFNVTMRKMGIAFTFVDPDNDIEVLRQAFQANTKAVFAESLSNPSGVVLDIEKFAALAHEHQVPLIVDNTFPTPIHCRPFEWGADIVVHSTTKYMDGHATSVGGALVDSGNFDWSRFPDKYPGLCQPDPSYHGLVYTERFGKGAYITKAVAQLMRDLGASPAPMNAFLLNIGLETLHLRMRRHSENALAVAKFLENHPRVAWVNYCALPSSKYFGLCQKYLPNGASGVIAFGVQGGREASVAFMERLTLGAIVTHVADARTSLLHPASTTHRQLSEAELIEAGVSQDLIRLSVGIENAEDIVRDLEKALAVDS